jgi:hypothetical protein
MNIDEIIAALAGAQSKVSESQSILADMSERKAQLEGSLDAEQEKLAERESIVAELFDQLQTAMAEKLANPEKPAYAKKST